MIDGLVNAMVLTRREQWPGHYIDNELANGATWTRQWNIIQWRFQRDLTMPIYRSDIDRAAEGAKQGHNCYIHGMRWVEIGIVYLQRNGIIMVVH